MEEQQLSEYEQAKRVQRKEALGRSLNYRLGKAASSLVYGFVVLVKILRRFVRDSLRMITGR
jgi:hypothetical protein